MRGLDLFAGIGGASLAMQAAGFEVVAHAEVEPFPCRVLEHRFPGVPNLGDVEKITADDLKPLGSIDVVSFGSPCQDWSVAGKRLGLKGHRSSLFHEAIRIVRLCQPRFAVFENVPGLFSSAGGWDFAAVLDTMEESGALDIAWRVLDAQWFGVPQRRRRIFLVADFRGERAGEILSISEGVQRHPAPSREAGKGTTRGSEDGFAFALRGRDEGARVEVSGDRTSSIRGEGGSGRDYVAQSQWYCGYCGDHYGAEAGVGQSPRCPGCGSNCNSSPEGTDRMTFVPTGFYANSGYKEDPVSGASAPLKGGKENAGQAAVAFGVSNDPSPKWVEETMPPLQSKEDGGGRMDVVAFAENQQAEIRTSEVHPQSTTGGGKAGQGYPAVSYFETRVARNGRGAPSEVANALKAEAGQTGKGDASPMALEGMAVRRLTPTECERLQGFPDGWTDIPHASDSARYRALGNAWAVPVGAWVMKRIAGVS